MVLFQTNIRFLGHNIEKGKIIPIQRSIEFGSKFPDTKITLLIDNSYKKEFIAMIDSGADLNVIQEGLIPTKYFYKTSHSLSHAGGKPLSEKK